MNYRKRTGFITLALMLAAAIPLAFAEKVCSVHDGDTFTTCSKKKIRVSGIDAPELSQPYGVQSRDYLKLLTEGKDIKLTCNGRSYTRRVCQVWVPMASGETWDLGRDLVRQGFAFDFAQYSHGAYVEAESVARFEHKGVWQLKDGGVRPWDFRHEERQAK